MREELNKVIPRRSTIANGFVDHPSVLNTIHYADLYGPGGPRGAGKAPKVLRNLKLCVKYGGKNTKYFEACQGTYMFLACFSTSIRDKKPTGMSDMSDIIGKYPNEIIKEDKKQFDKLIKEVASMKKEDKKYSSSNLLKFQMQHTAEFSAIIKKIVSMAEKDIAKNK